MAKRKWTKEIIVERLRKWHEEGVPANALYRQDSAMTSMACYLFGSWRKTLDEAGIKPARKRWHRDRIISELQQTRGQGLPVTYVLVAAARREFGTLRAACKAAGVRCLCRKLAHLDWDRDMVIEAIKKRHADGRPLQLTTHEAPRLYATAVRLFGTWGNARAAAGLPRPPMGKLSADEVVATIRDHAAGGGDVADLRRDEIFYRSARRRFESWLNACEAAGVSVKRVRRWTPEKVIQAILKRQTDGLDLHKTWQEDQSLNGAARHHFGSWRVAIKAAGIEPIRTERWNKQRVIERLRVWHERGTATNLVQSDSRLSSACYRYFGSHVAAMEAAGIERRESNGRNGRVWTKERVLVAIQDRFLAGDPKDQFGFGDRGLGDAAKRLFGSWLDAVAAAGLKDKVNFKPNPRRWDPESVILEIQKWKARGGRLIHVHQEFPSLFIGAKTHFGSWNKAIEAAGLTPERKRHTSAEILAMIRHRHREGLSLDSRDPGCKYLLNRTRRRFGSWEKGLIAAGVVSPDGKKVAS